MGRGNGSLFKSHVGLCPNWVLVSSALLKALIMHMTLEYMRVSQK